MVGGLKASKLYSWVAISLLSVSIGLFVYYLTHNYQLPLVFIGEKKEVQGYVFRAKFIRQGKSGYLQNISYVYQVNSIWHCGYGRFGREDGALAIGEIIQVEYGSSFPGQSAICGALGSDYISQPNEYLAVSDNEINKLLVSSNVIVHYLSQNHDQIAEENVGLATYGNDSTVLVEWLNVNTRGMDEYQFSREPNRIYDTLIFTENSWRFSSDNLIYR